MQPGLVRFGTDFGNGEADRRFFPRDVTRPRYLAEKARVLAAYPERTLSDVRSDGDARALGSARAFIASTLEAEGYGDCSALSLAELGPRLCEDFAVLVHPPGGADRVVWLHACFPGGWRPEKVIGRSFTELHAPVVGFEGVARSAPTLTSAMVSRGPYVRFVWTISADDELDHHPEQGRRQAWSSSTRRGFLRVERQITLPLPAESACVFLIRTYVYGFDELSAAQRDDLSLALARMPPELARYKRLESALPRALELLG